MSTLNVVTIHDVGQESGRYFLVLELMEGGDVEHLIEDSPDGRLDTATVVRVGSDMARGLAHAHSNGILHRDIKPGNAWLTSDGIAKLGDFGLAYLGGGTRLTRAGMMVGTVAYMAPEVALGRQADERSDLYMLGASLYEMVTGRVPFEGDDPVRVIFSHINDMPLNPRRLVPDIPTALETLITRLLSKDPEQRPADAGAVLDALGSIDLTSGPATRRSDSTSAIQQSAQATTPEPRWAQPVVGRDRELGALRARVDAAMQGQGGLIFITGEAGIGKTRLATELRAYARGRGCQWLEGRYEKEGSIPLQSYVEAVRAYIRTAQQGALISLVGPYATELVRSFPDIAAGLGAAPVADTTVENDPQAARQRLLESICHLFTSIAKQQPLVLFLDDLQWAPSMDAVQALAQRASGEPLLIIGAYRESEVRDRQALSRSVLAMNRDRLFQPVPLSRLDHGQVGEMVAQALGQASSGDAIELIYQRTEGNPFFVEELVRYLVESSALTLGDQGWDIRETPSLQMPDSVKVVVEERLERLEEEARRMLAMASVIGQEFSLPLLQEVVDLDEDSLLDAVEQALESRVLVPRSGVGQEVYAFADNQVREVLYEGISAIRQRRYHLRVAEAIEKVHERHLEEYYGALEYHFTQGNDVEKAVDYAVKAGDLAYTNSVFPRARNHYQVAAELLEELGEESERAAHVHSQLGMNLVTGYTSAWAGEGAERDVEHIQRAIDLFVKGGNVRRAAALHRTLGAANVAGTGVAPNYDEALRHYKAGATLLEDQPDSLEKAVAYDGLAFGYFTGLDLERAEEVAIEAVRIAEAIRDPDALALAYTDLGLVLAHRGRITEGLSYSEQAWAAAQQAKTVWYRDRTVSYPLSQYPQLSSMAHSHRWLDRWDELETKGRGQRYEAGTAWHRDVVLIQLGRGDEARDVLGQHEPTIAAAFSEWYAHALSMLGEWESAERFFLGMLERHGFGSFENRLPRVAAAYGGLFLQLNEAQRAQELLQPAWVLCQERGAVTSELGLLPVLCRTYVLLGRLEEAQSCLARAQEIIAVPEDWLGLPAAVYFAEGVLAAAESRYDEAEAAFQRAADTSEQHGMLYDQAQALYEWAVMYLERNQTGDRERGSELLDRALDIFTRCDARKDVEKVIARKEFLGA